MACAICESRRPRRFCPGVRGDICSICCGTEREVTVHCPLDCEYLQEARHHERTAATEPPNESNPDIRVSEKFLRDNEMLIDRISRSLLTATFETPGAVDSDMREALEALIRTYRTLQTGLYYESRPDNPVAAGIFSLVHQQIGEIRQADARETGISRTRDTDVLGVLVFLHRLEADYTNGRRLGRAFLDWLRDFFPPEERVPSSGSSRLILP